MQKRERWENIAPFPNLRRESHFGNRVVQCYEGRPNDCTVLLSENVLHSPDREALVCDDVRITYSQLDRVTTRICNRLRSNGVSAGGRVALLLENSVEYIAYIFSVLKLGAIVVPVNVRESERQIAYILRDANVKCLVCHSIFENLVPYEEFKDEQLSVILLRGVEDLQIDESFEDLSIDLPEIESEDTAFLIYTSGTTGTPKGAVVTHLNALHSIMNYKAAMQLGQHERSIAAVPISHITGIVALVLTVIGASGLLIIMRKFNADAFIDLAQAEGMTHTLLVPAMLNLILMSQKLQDTHLSDWRVLGSGGSILPEQTLASMADKFPNLNVYNCYGATETTSPAVIMPSAYAMSRATQVGLPVPCADILIADKNGNESATREIGEVWISGPMVVPGYWHNSEAGVTEFFGGYWKSGDLGWVDENGFLTLVDRKRYVINRGGYKIYPSEVEATLLENKDILDCAVVGFNCSVLGERVAAFVSGSDEISADVVIKFCKEKLAEYKVPEEIITLESIPRNANGKILKSELVALANDIFTR